MPLELSTKSDAQRAGKALQLAVEPFEDLPYFMDELDPRGVMVFTHANSVEEADAFISKLSRWTAKGKY